MSKPLSAIDCISPALALTKKQLFAPFRIKRWLRLAVVCLRQVISPEAVEAAGISTHPISHGKSGRSSSAFPSHGLGEHPSVASLDHRGSSADFRFRSGIHLCGIGISLRPSGFRSVRSMRIERKLGAMGALWQKLFLLESFHSCSFSSLEWDFSSASRCWSPGNWDFFIIPANTLRHWSLGDWLFSVLFAYYSDRAVIGLFAKDFCVPIMALDEVGYRSMAAVLPIVAAEKLAFTVYVLMKIVLAIAAAILAGNRHPVY